MFYFVILPLYERLCWTIVEKEGGAVSPENFLRIEKAETAILITSLNSTLFVHFVAARLSSCLGSLQRNFLTDRALLSPPSPYPTLSLNLLRLRRRPLSSLSGRVRTDGRGEDKDTAAGEGNDVVPRRSPKAGSRFERRSLTFFRSPGSWLPRDLVPYVPNDLEDLPFVAFRLCRLPPFTLDQIARWESRCAQRDELDGRWVYERAESSFRLSVVFRYRYDKPLSLERRFLCAHLFYRQFLGNLISHSMIGNMTIDYWREKEQTKNINLFFYLKNPLCVWFENA